MEENLVKKIKHEIWSVPMLLIFSILAPILAWGNVLNFCGEPTSSWFQRSGALMVLFAVWAEFNIFRVGYLSNPISDDTKSWWDYVITEELNFKFSGIVSYIKYATALVAISGTFIWGYGDILYKVAT